MFSRPIASPQARAGIARYQLLAVTAWHRLILGATLLLAALLNFWQLGKEGYGNTYYAAAIKSMLQSWHNSFVSFDPGAFVTIDKPPLDFWIQTLSAKLCGFSGVSLLLPESIAGLGLFGILIAAVLRIFQYAITGQTSTPSLVLLMGGIQLIFLGILGEYLGRIYDEVRGRPLYIVREVLGPSHTMGGINR